MARGDTYDPKEDPEITVSFRVEKEEIARIMENAPRMRLEQIYYQLWRNFSSEGIATSLKLLPSLLLKQAQSRNGKSGVVPLTIEQCQEKITETYLAWVKAGAKQPSEEKSQTT